jgi:hypothetical protein
VELLTKSNLFRRYILHNIFSAEDVHCVFQLHYNAIISEIQSEDDLMNPSWELDSRRQPLTLFFSQ